MTMCYSFSILNKSDSYSFISYQLKTTKNRGISILGNFIYVTSNDEVKMSRIHRWDRSVSVTNYHDIRLPDPYQLQVYHLQRQPSKKTLHSIFGAFLSALFLLQIQTFYKMKLQYQNLKANVT